MDRLRLGGFDAVLNVSEFEPTAAEFDRVGLDVAWVPLPNTCPADEDTEAACGLQLRPAHAFVASQLGRDRRVLVHCAWGRDRTGLILANYVARTSGLSAAKAIVAVRAVRPKALTAPGWEAMARRLIDDPFARRG